MEVQYSVEYMWLKRKAPSPIWLLLSDLIQIQLVRYQSRIRLSAGLFSLVCANCSGSFSEDSLIFLNISSKVLTLSLGLEPDMFTLQANSPTAVLLTLNDKLVNVSIHVDSDVKKRVKNKLCFILCQDVAFEDKMNCQFQRVSN